MLFVFRNCLTAIFVIVVVFQKAKARLGNKRWRMGISLIRSLQEIMRTRLLQVMQQHSNRTSKGLMNIFLDENGYPGIKPPWGTLNAVDLNSGKLLWKVPLGEYDELTKKGIAPTGTENYGGPLVTKSGLVFIAATKDEKIRAFDSATGKILWEARLPAAGYATPATYTINGRQYLVIACGGGKIGSKSGDSFVAFSLPASD